jgi:hypothetical protein
VIRRKTQKSVIPGFMWLAVLVEAHFSGVLSWLLSKFFYIENGVRYSWRERPD